MNNAKKAIDSVLAESLRSGHDVIDNLKGLGFSVVPNNSTDEDGTYTVEKNGRAVILDLSSDEDLHDSIRSIQAAFDMDVDLDYNGFPTMSQKFSDKGLAQRVASIGQ